MSFIYDGAVVLNKNNAGRLYFLAFTTDCAQLRESCVEFMGSTYVTEFSFIMFLVLE